MPYCNELRTDVLVNRVKIGEMYRGEGGRVLTANEDMVCCRHPDCPEQPVMGVGNSVVVENGVITSCRRR